MLGVETKAARVETARTSATMVWNKSVNKKRQIADGVEAPESKIHCTNTDSCRHFPCWLSETETELQNWERWRVPFFSLLDLTCQNGNDNLINGLNKISHTID